MRVSEVAVIFCLFGLAAVGVAAMQPAPKPTAPIRAESIFDRSPRIRYLCSITNEQAMVYITSDGVELDPMPTGRSCDYAQWRANGGPYQTGW